MYKTRARKSEEEQSYWDQVLLAREDQKENLDGED